MIIKMVTLANHSIEYLGLREGFLFYFQFFSVMICNLAGFEDLKI